MHKVNVILISGGTCSGKSEFTKWFHNAVVISQDDFYKGKSQLLPDENGYFDFDKPDAIDIAACAQAIEELLRTGKTRVPEYDMAVSERVGNHEVTLEQSINFVVIEGIFAFYPPLDAFPSMKIFIDTPMEVRLARRMLRDMKRKGKTKLEILAEFGIVEQRYQQYIEPMKKSADLIIPFSYSQLQFMQ